MDVFMGVVSCHAQSCYEHGINPDLDELERYNQEAKERECPHANQRNVHLDDDRSYRKCVDCTKSHDLPVPATMDGMPYEKWRSLR
jgi:hypothetical protein